MKTQILTKISLPDSFKTFAVLGLFIASLFVSSGVVGAATEAELRALTDNIQNQIEDNEDVIEGLETEIGSLNAAVQLFDVEIEIAQDKIRLTDLNIEQLQLRLAEAEAELLRQQGILEETLVTIYIEGDTSAVELIFASDNFGEYFQEQQYLESLKISVQDSVEAVTTLKKQIADEKLQQEELQRKQEVNRDILASKRTEQQSLLDRTRGEEAAYKEIVDDLQQQLIDAQNELADLLAAQNFVSLGSVQQGDIIGYAGSTGFSTGPHLHFAVYDNGSFANPYASGGQMTYGLSWPLPTVSTNSISQLYGCQSQIVYATSCGGGSWLHAGLDVSAWYGEPIAAAGSGEIVYRGWLGGYGNSVIIDHGGGVQTYYAHMSD